jgi:hypothetical protein
MLSILSQPSTTPEVEQQQLAALSHLRSSAYKELSSRAVVQALLYLLRQTDSSAALLCKVLETVQQLTVQQPGFACQWAAAPSSGCATIFECALQHAGNKQLQNLAIRAVEALAQDADSRGDAASAGLSGWLLSHLASRDSSVSLKCVILSALGHLALHSDGRSAIVTQGGVDALLAITSSSSSSELQAEACRALAALDPHTAVQSVQQYTEQQVQIMLRQPCFRDDLEGPTKGLRQLLRSGAASPSQLRLLRSAAAAAGAAKGLLAVLANCSVFGSWSSAVAIAAAQNAAHALASLLQQSEGAAAVAAEEEGVDLVLSSLDTCTGSRNCSNEMLHSLTVAVCSLIRYGKQAQGTLVVRTLLEGNVIDTLVRVISCSRGSSSSAAAAAAALDALAQLAADDDVAYVITLAGGLEVTMQLLEPQAAKLAHSITTTTSSSSSSGSSSSSSIAVSSKHVELCSTVCSAAAAAVKLLQQRGPGAEESNNTRIHIPHQPNVWLQLAHHSLDAELRQRGIAVAEAAAPALSSTGAAAALVQLLRTAMQCEGTAAVPAPLLQHTVQALGALALHSVSASKVVAAGAVPLLVSLLGDLCCDSTYSSTGSAAEDRLQLCDAVTAALAHLTYCDSSSSAAMWGIAEAGGVDLVIRCLHFCTGCSSSSGSSSSSVRNSSLRIAAASARVLHALCQDTDSAEMVQLAGGFTVALRLLTEEVQRHRSCHISSCSSSTGSRDVLEAAAVQSMVEAATIGDSTQEDPPWLITAVNESEELVGTLVQTLGLHACGFAAVESALNVLPAITYLEQCYGSSSQQQRLCEALIPAVPTLQRLLPSEDVGAAAQLDAAQLLQDICSLHVAGKLAVLAAGVPMQLRQVLWKTQDHQHRQQQEHWRQQQQLQPQQQQQEKQQQQQQQQEEAPVLAQLLKETAAAALDNLGLRSNPDPPGVKQQKQMQLSAELQKNQPAEDGDEDDGPERTAADVVRLLYLTGSKLWQQPGLLQALWALLPAAAVETQELLHVLDGMLSPSSSSSSSSSSSGSSSNSGGNSSSGSSSSGGSGRVSTLTMQWLYQWLLQELDGLERARLHRYSAAVRGMWALCDLVAHALQCVPPVEAELFSAQQQQQQQQQQRFDQQQQQQQQHLSDIAAAAGSSHTGQPLWPRSTVTDAIWLLLSKGNIRNQLLHRLDNKVDITHSHIDSITMRWLQDEVQQQLRQQKKRKKQTAGKWVVTAEAAAVV